MFLWCVQEVAELKEEDIISHTATATQLPTATATQLPTDSAVAIEDGISRTLSEFYLEKAGPPTYKTLHAKVKYLHGNSITICLFQSCLAVQAVLIMISQSIFNSIIDVITYISNHNQ